MCTLTWIVDQEGCRIFFNRDEKRTRLPARPPEEVEIDGTRILTPVDGNAGGSWLTVNEHGLCVAVLNFYEADARMPESGMRHKSRGHLVLGLSACSSLDDAKEKISDLNTTEFRPFFLILFDGEGGSHLAKWDGFRLSQKPLTNAMRPLTTSSVKTKHVLKARSDKLEELSQRHGGVSEEMLREFQHSRDDAGGAFSVTMTRDDAQTVSYSEVTVRKDDVSFYYQPREMDVDDPPYLTGQTYKMNRA